MARRRRKPILRGEGSAAKPLLVAVQAVCEVLYVRTPSSVLKDSMLIVLPSVVIKPRTECFCQARAAVSSSSEAPFLREIRPRRICFLLPFFDSALAGASAGREAWAFTEAAAGACSVVPAAALAGPVSFCTSAKMRFAATARLVNFLTGVTPVRLFQISISRL